MRLNEIDKTEALRYMGHKSGNPIAEVSLLLERCEKLIVNDIRPLYVYREASLEKTCDGIKICGSNLILCGNDIAKHLKDCTKAVVFAATLTADADRLIRHAEASDVAEAFAIDALCSAAIEQVCDRAEDEIFEKYNANIFRTFRYSPGYGDLPLEIQKSLCNYLNAQRRIGLTVTDDFLMIPRKSVTAIIGISEKPLEKHGGCEVCNMRQSCAFSKLNGGKGCRK